MADILILGASSQIGQELALRFSPKNSLTLSGRNREALQRVADRCLSAGAACVDLMVQDMADGDIVNDRQFDLVINLVAATSRVKDSEFPLSQLESYLNADLLVPIRFLQGIIEKPGKPLKIIFVSSVLASVKSPDRMLYGSLKALQLMCLQKLTLMRQGDELLVVNVGRVIPHNSPTREASKLADAIYGAHARRQKVLNYGLVGRIFVLLFYTQPLIFDAIVKLQRALRKGT
jgi:short-subunit dehydrogenase